MSAITHPVWCDLTRCTAQPTPTLEEYRQAGSGTFGEHQSTPIQAIGATVTARQSVCPWETSVFLTITGDMLAGVPGPTVAAAELVDALTALGLAGGAR